ncbi:MAG TPA: hypothetical protein VME66_12020 [Candidatus Acidoferrales bacterium]|nr:hypothetical protein [Candidatus Acidoferrales bacterium]
MVLPNVRRLPVVERFVANSRRRLLLAFFLAIALHAIAGVFFSTVPQPVAEIDRTISERVTIVQRTPAPTPAPRPTPPVTPPPRASIAPVFAVYAPAPKAAAPMRKTRGGLAAHRHLSLVTPPPVPLHPQRVSFAENTGAGVADGGMGVGAGVGVGSGGDAGTSSGVAGVGEGTGSDAATAPCGYVEFEATHQERRSGKEYVWVEILVHLRNGETVTDDLGWPFVYANDAQNPFSAQNDSNPNFTTTMQPPPPDYDLETEQKPATVLAVRRTGPDGYTLLDPCPGSAPRPLARATDQADDGL